MFSSDVLLSSMGVSPNPTFEISSRFQTKMERKHTMLEQICNVGKNVICTNFGLGTKFKLQDILALREWLNLNETSNMNDFLIYV
jgi:hypothetical protein